MGRRTLLLLVLVSVLVAASKAKDAPGETWSFAVSGDSRNCGDVVMPAIAKSVLEKKVEFYWHLGDFRIGYAVDEDMRDQ